MPRITRYTFQFALIALLMLPLPALAIPAITCHCFTDRSYEPGHPAAADPYFLATTQNSFFAQVFNIDKKSIVFKKQQGISSDNLWIAYWVASRSGAAPDSLLQAKQDNGTWPAALASLQISPKTLGSRFSHGLAVRPSSARLAETVVDELFLHYHLLADTELSALRKAGTSNQELIIATLVAARTRQPARQIVLAVNNGSKTWGSLLAWASIDPAKMQQELARILNLQPL
ncbi:MAG: hypothetical protein M0T70_10615 [Geobacteraceae bacterium]|nr:hypothetical protein [Geobacteraceae bacterium]